MPIMRDKRGLAASAAGGAKNEKKKLPAAKSASKAAATTKPIPAQPQPTNAAAKPAPVIAPKPAPMLAPQKVSGDAKPANRPAAAQPAQAAKHTAVASDARATVKETPAPAKPSNVTPIKSASSEVAKAQQQAAAPATPAPARPVIDVRELAQAVIAHTTPALESGFKKVDARLDGIEKATKNVAARIEAAEAAAKRAEAKVGSLETHVQKEIEKGLSGLSERIEKLAKSTAKAAQAAEAAQKAAARPEPVVPMGLEAELDQIGRTVKRAFVESFERSMDHVALPLVKVQRYIEEIARRAGTEAQGLSEHLAICVTSLAAVLTDLGVESFAPEASEEFDPIIHQQVGEGHRADVLANAILKCVAPGYRSAGGYVLLPALVVVNRR